MLIYVIQDEYTARSEYELILNKFDINRPFSNIIKAEIDAYLDAVATI